MKGKDTSWMNISDLHITTNVQIHISLSFYWNCPFLYSDHTCTIFVLSCVMFSKTCYFQEINAFHLHLITSASGLELLLSIYGVLVFFVKHKEFSKDKHYRKLSKVLLIDPAIISIWLHFANVMPLSKKQTRFKDIYNTEVECLSDEHNCVS